MGKKKRRSGAERNGAAETQIEKELGARGVRRRKVKQFFFFGVRDHEEY